MPANQFPPIQPTPLKGTLKKEDVIRAVDAAKAKRLKEEAERAEVITTWLERNPVTWGTSPSLS
jgi:hypothetical protein